MIRMALSIATGLAHLHMDIMGTQGDFNVFNCSQSQNEKVSIPDLKFRKTRYRPSRLEVEKHSGQVQCDVCNRRSWIGCKARRDQRHGGHTFEQQSGH